MAKPGSQAKKRNWLLIVFGSSFAIPMVVLILNTQLGLYDWYRMSFWQAVPAELLFAELQSSRSDDSTIYKAVARYRYDYAEKDYHNNRVAINTDGDNVGDFHQQLGSRLKSAFKASSPIMIWVNPENPRESVIDRSLRLRLLMLKVSSMLIFGGIGIGLIFWGWRGSTEIDHPDAAHFPWLKYPAWNQNRIRSDQKITLWVAWGLTVFWNLISIPSAILALDDAIQRNNHKAFLVLIFPAMGLGLLCWAIKVSQNWRRYGDPYLTLDPFPGAIGGQFGAQLELPLAYSANYSFKVTLNCILVQSSSGPDSTTSEILIWQKEGFAKVQPSATGSLISFRFDIPAQLPASQPQGQHGHRWRLTIASQQATPAFSRTYIVPVYATGKKSQLLTDSAETHPLMQQSRAADIEAVCNIQQVAGGVKLYLPYGRARNPGLLMFGLVFAASGWLAGILKAPTLFAALFGGVGGAIFLYALYSLGNCLRVQLDRQGLEYQRKIFGINLTRVNIPQSQIHQLICKKSYISQSGNQHHTIYRVQVQLVNGKTFTIADNLKGRDAAEQVMQSISLSTGYPYYVKD